MMQDVILDTDIGTDIDDAYAVLLALGSPELRIRGITLVHADIETRARIALKLLKLAIQAGVPVDEIVSSWQEELRCFMILKQRHGLYL